jgi:hypothetical protein
MEAVNESELICRYCPSLPFAALVQYKGFFARAAYPGKVAKQGIDIVLKKADTRHASDRIETACRTEHFARSSNNMRRMCGRHDHLLLDIGLK